MLAIRFILRTAFRSAWGVALLALGFTASAHAVTMFGALSNFDVINDTGETCRGFQIELEGIHPSDIAFTFGAPYIRYGDPSLVDTGTGTIVRYASGFSGGNWSVGTPVPAAPFTTGGHQLFDPAYGGDPDYLTLGGEHFGVALNGNPTNTIYRWLLGDVSGNLYPSGSNVKIPAPVWNVTPPVANPAAPAAVQVIIEAPPKENPAALFGEAMWVKVYVTELPEPADLEGLVVGNPEVPGWIENSDGELEMEPAEVEVEWFLLQEGRNGNEELDSGAEDMLEDSQSVSRRFEFYKYTGTYDEEGEAIDEDPLADPSIVGEFIGGQNAALNLDAFVIPEPTTLAIMVIAITGVTALRRRSR